MTIKVFPVIPQYSLTHVVEVNTYIADMGDGFEQRVNKNLNFSRADGRGEVRAYKGRNKFQLVLNKLRHVNGSTTEDATVLWKFYIDCLGNYEAFYFYNPAEKAVPDPTGTETQGRYLVRFAEANLSRELFIQHLYNYGLTLLEVRA